MAHVRIGIVTHRRPETNVFLASCLTLANKFGSDIIWSIEQNADVSPSRNQIIRDLKEPYLLLLDDDMEFKPLDLERVLKKLSKNPEMGALSALYYKWDGSDLPVVHFKDNGKWMEDDEKSSFVQGLSGVHPVDGFGGGFLLIDSDVFKQVDPPWFQAGYGLLDSRKYEYMSNDVYFCQKLKRAGYSPSVDFDLVLNHWGLKSYHGPESPNENRSPVPQKARVSRLSA